jgi:hypothetical protein
MNLYEFIWIYVNIYELEWMLFEFTWIEMNSYELIRIYMGRFFFSVFFCFYLNLCNMCELIWICIDCAVRQCETMRQCVTVRQCGVWQCSCAWQHACQCVAVRTAVCGSALHKYIRHKYIQHKVAHNLLCLVCPYTKGSGTETHIPCMLILTDQYVIHIRIKVN